MKCNPEAKKKGPLENMNMAIPSIYVGETARSVQERSRETGRVIEGKTTTTTW